MYFPTFKDFGASFHILSERHLRKILTFNPFTKRKEMKYGFDVYVESEKFPSSVRERLCKFAFSPLAVFLGPLSVTDVPYVDDKRRLFFCGVVGRFEGVWVSFRPGEVDLSHLEKLPTCFKKLCERDVAL